MPQGGIFRIDPPPVQLGPFVPIPRQGDQPPKITAYQLAKQAAQASWPTGLDPDRSQPDLHRGFIAPLTLIYGQQPPRNTSFQLAKQAAQAIWPTGLDPDRVQPNLRYGQIAPLTLRYGSQPPYTTAFQLAKQAAQALWPTGLDPDRSQPDLHRGYTAPLTLRYGSQPPFVTAYQLYEQQIILKSWDPPPPQPQRDPKNFAPLTLLYGDQPPPLGNLNDVDVFYPVRFAWEPPPPLPTIPQLGYIVAQTLVYGGQPPVTSGMRDLDIYSQVYSWAWQPPDPLPTLPSRRYVAPQTLVYGSQPPPRAGYATPDFNTLVRTWDQPTTLPAQMVEYIAPFIVNVVSNLPVGLFAQNSAVILSAWIPPDNLPRQKGQIAPLTLPYGDQPPATAGYRGSTFDAEIRSWQPPDPQPTIPNYRGYTAPLALVYGDQPPRSTSKLFQQPIIVSSWQPPAPQPQRDQKTFAPLTLAYGDQPPATAGYRRAVFSTEIQSWVPPDPLPTLPRNFAPQTLAYGDAPPLRKPAPPAGSWEQYFPLQPSPHIAALVIPPETLPPLFLGQTSFIVSLWAAPERFTDYRTLVAPLTLPRGDEPPVIGTSRISFSQTIVNWVPPPPLPTIPFRSISILDFTGRVYQRFLSQPGYWAQIGMAGGYSATTRACASRAFALSAASGYSASAKSRPGYAFQISEN